MEDICSRGSTAVSSAVSFMERSQHSDPTVLRSEFKHNLIERVTRKFVTEIRVEGIENLHKARELRGNGPQVWFVNHLSHADSPVLISALKREGFDDLADNLVFLLGARLMDTPLVNKVLNANSYIPVWPPTDVPETEKERLRAAKMSRNAILGVRNTFEQNKILVVYAEGGRSYEGELKKGDVRASHYLDLPGGHVFPWALSGTEKILPVKKFWPNKGSVDVSIGEPISMDNLKERYKDFKKDERREMIVDDVMYNLATMLPENYRGIYKLSRTIEGRE